MPLHTVCCKVYLSYPSYSSYLTSAAPMSARLIRRRFLVIFEGVKDRKLKVFLQRHFFRLHFYESMIWYRIETAFDLPPSRNSNTHGGITA
jgi:hypothetical protein